MLPDPSIVTNLHTVTNVDTGTFRHKYVSQLDEQVCGHETPASLHD